MRITRHHASIRFFGFFQRKRFDHGANVGEDAEVKVSCVSIALPVRLPTTSGHQEMSGTPLTGIGSPETPTTTSFPQQRGREAGWRLLLRWVRLPGSRSAPPSFCSRGSRILSFSVDVNVSAQLRREMFLCLYERLRRCENPSSLHTARQDVLTTNTLDSDGIACASGVAERIERRDAGRKPKGPRLLI